MTPDSARIVQLWPQLEGCVLRLINYSENHTFLSDGPRGRFLLRVHRPGYHDRDAISDELAWVAALSRDTGIAVPEALPGRDGQLVQTLDGDRLAVLFRFFDGREATEADTGPDLFRRLGDIAARFHLQASHWALSAPSTRHRWDSASILAPDGPWGDWRSAPRAGGFPEIEAAETKLRSALVAYGTGADRFGLIHADMRLANVILDGDDLRIIDFDDCGFGWFMYDFAASVSFFETSPEVAGLKAAWLDGYTSVRPLAAADIEMIDAMVLLRRINLLAWIGSHAETSLAQIHAPDFAEGTADLARRFLG